MELWAFSKLFSLPENTQELKKNGLIVF